MRMTMKHLNTNMPTRMAMGTIYTAMRSCPRVNTAIGIGTRQHVMNTRMCRMPITCTRIDGCWTSHRLP